jgi:hypothetical protein
VPTLFVVIPVFEEPLTLEPYVRRALDASLPPGWRAHLLHQVLPWLSEDRFGVEPQLVAALARLRAEVREVPESYDPRDRSRGKKIGPLDGLRAIWVILVERARRSPPRRD